MGRRPPGMFLAYFPRRGRGGPSISPTYCQANYYSNRLPCFFFMMPVAIVVSARYAFLVWSMLRVGK